MYIIRYNNIICKNNCDSYYSFRCINEHYIFRIYFIQLESYLATSSIILHLNISLETNNLFFNKYN